MAEIYDPYASGTSKRPRPKGRPPLAAKARPTRAKTAKKKTTAKAASEPAGARAAKLAAKLVDFERTTFDTAAKLLGSINQQSEKALRHVVSNTSWMPKEGQKLVEEWQRTLRHSLKDFTKTVDKSFDLLSKYLARVQAETSREKK